MRLRNGKRSLKDLLKIYEKRHPAKKNSLNDDQVVVEVLKYGDELTKEATRQDKIAKKYLKESDDITKKLYKINQQINDDFVKIVEEKTKKNPKKKLIKELESRLVEQKEQHKYLLKKSKQNLLWAKRHAKMI